MEAEKSYLVRFFDKEWHARNFVDGKVRLGRVGAYANMENGGRGDPYEGVSGIARPHDTTPALTPSDTDIPYVLKQENGFLEASWAYQVNLSSYILCMSLVPVSTLDGLRCGLAKAMLSLKLDTTPFIDGMAKIEAYAVLIGTGWSDFHQALSIGAKISNGNLTRCDRVEYGDFANSGRSHFDLDCFSKDVKFEDQREFRCQFEFPNVREDNHLINVGYIKSSIKALFRLTLDLTTEDEDLDSKKQSSWKLGAINLSI